jgi:hypothetical protein
MSLHDKGINGYIWRTNFYNEDLYIYQHAIDIQDNKNDFLIINDAYDDHGRPLHDYMAIYMVPEKKLGEFFQCIEFLRNKLKTSYLNFITEEEMMV